MYLKFARTCKWKYCENKCLKRNETEFTHAFYNRLVVEEREVESDNKIQELYYIHRNFISPLGLV